MQNSSENKNEKAGRNKIAILLEAIGYGTYVFGFLAGFALANVEIPFTYISGSYTEFSFRLAIIYWVGFFVSGSVFLGFAEIIYLLQKLANQRELMHTFDKEGKKIKREELFDDLPEL